MVRSATGDVGVTSVAELFAVFTSPPPATVAVFVTMGGAVAATLTVRMKAGKLAPAASTSERIAVTVWPLNETVQPLIVPLSAAVGAKAAGSASLTVTAPAVGAPPTLLTTIA